MILPASTAPISIPKAAASSSANARDATLMNWASVVTGQPICRCLRKMTFVTNTRVMRTTRINAKEPAESAHAAIDRRIMTRKTMMPPISTRSVGTWVTS